MRGKEGGRGGAKEWKKEEIRESTEKEFLCGRNEFLAHKYMLPVQLALLRFTILYTHINMHISNI